MTDALITSDVVELVRARGWARVTMGALARAAGVSRQTLYNRFGSRESVAEAYVVREIDLAFDAAFTVVGAYEDPTDALAAAVDVLLAQVARSLAGALSAASEPDRFIALTSLTLAHGVERLADLVGWLRADLPVADRRAVADVLCRLIVSNAMVPPEDRGDAVAAMVSRLQL
ncbi:TetR/AcrR family transcriptional regulator [Nocardioides humilatus]|uniref:TetR/AcrR family transcriptional regulator n=1 Tax=Nocardioides humilatus TaxID=2607660 RepID=A0A5B1L7Z3_9ACTN|nr:TetR/AcrR family transcriptional regulator [Nocardioides humilatus]KAA1416813.1 TetR/AcrR family transcriptional regulator [Nocardioides humilatus]